MTEISPAEQIFFAALAINSQQDRAAYLDQACGDPALRARVERLLAAQPNVGGFLEPLTGPLHPLLAATADYSSSERVGTILVGRYTLAEKIGEGGMGEVWAAKQTEPVKRKVAVKLIKAGMDSQAVLARFEAERQALALMDHPNIAKVHDAGVTPDGRPFFVMELVNGLPLTKFCDDARLTPRQRLELFVPICQAVQHAHQKGIVHRDLKPSNILITLYDGRPVPKVIDFGVAKATGGKLTDETLSTLFGAVVGTLEYMSPEQAGFSAIDIDTRADIYSLGVLLYELLTGLRPIDAKRLKAAALTEMIRIIQEEEPSKPSLRLSTDDALQSLAALRQIEPKKLMAQLRGELDWIVMKCLEKDRNRRYETATDLARDLRRYLADEVVEARPPSPGYRLRKLVRRNKGRVVGASLVLLSLLIGIVGTTSGLIQSRRQRDVADQARQNEAAERLRAEAQRQQAETYLVRGLLRPLGYSSAVGQTVSPELKGLADMAALPDDRLKLLCLSVALADPDTALRSSRQAERLIQATVGPSPVRHRAALRLISEKQRDASADVWVRLAACRLAIALGSDDLPALDESIRHLLQAEPTVFAGGLGGGGPVFTAEWDSFFKFNEGPLTQAQVSRVAETLTASFEALSLKGRPLIAAEPGPTADDRRQDALAASLTALAPRFSAGDARRVAVALVGVFAGLSEERVHGGVSEALVAACERLEVVGTRQIAPSLLALAANHSGGDRRFYACQVLGRLHQRLDQNSVGKFADILLAILSGKPTVSVAPMAWILSEIVGGMDHAAALKAAETLADLVARSKQGKDLWAVGEPLGHLLERLGEAGIPPSLSRAAENAASLLGNPKDRDNRVGARSKEEILAASKPGVSLNAVGNSKNRDNQVGAGRTLAVLGRWLDPAQANRITTALVALMEKEDDPDVQLAIGFALGGVATRVDSATASAIATRLLGSVREPVGGWRNWIALTALTALAPKLDTAASVKIADAAMTLIGKSRNRDTHLAAYAALAALAPRLDPATARRAADALVTLFDGESKLEWGMLIGSFKYALDRILPRLDPADRQAILSRAAAGLLGVLEMNRGGLGSALLATVDSYDDWPFDAASSLRAAEARVAQMTLATGTPRAAGDEHLSFSDFADLAFLITHVEPVARQRLALNALRERFALRAIYFQPDTVDPNGDEMLFDPPAEHFLRLIDDWRPLAELLAHPACVEPLRTPLIHRLEYLLDPRPLPPIVSAALAAGPAAFPNVGVWVACERARYESSRRFRTAWDLAAWLEERHPEFTFDPASSSSR